MKALSVVLVLVVAMGFGMMGCNDNADPLVAPNDQAVAQSSQVTNTPAKKASPHLTGTMNIDFTGTPPFFWVGTIVIGSETYGLRFENLSGPPREYSGASPFEETFEIWNEGFQTLYLKGTDAGVVVYANDRFVANGKVEEAYGPFAMWLGRSAHIRGIITWEIEDVVPDFATGTLRIN